MTVQERRQKQHRANAAYKAAKRKIRQHCEIKRNEFLLEGTPLAQAEAAAEAIRKAAIRVWKFRTPSLIRRFAMKNGSYPKSNAKQRIYRMWDESKKKNVRYRYFAYATNACDRAMCEIKRSQVGETLTVYDSSNGQYVEQYTRKISSLVISKNPLWKGQS